LFLPKQFWNDISCFSFSIALKLCIFVFFRVCESLKSIVLLFTENKKQAEHPSATDLLMSPVVALIKQTKTKVKMEEQVVEVQREEKRSWRRQEQRSWKRRSKGRRH
jgi:hypothetical protein